MTTGRHFENWSMAVSTKSWLIIADDVNYGVVHFRLLCKEYLTLFKKLSLVVFCCKFWTLEQKLHDYICSGCKNMVSQKCAVFIGPPCTMLTNPHWVSVIEATSIVNCMTIHCVQKKKHPLTFSFISPWRMREFKQKLRRIYPRKGRFWKCIN